MSQNVPSWYRQTYQNFQAQGVDPRYWLGVAIAENNSFNATALNSQGEYSVGPWQYNLVPNARGGVWMQAMNWTREVAQRIFSNPVTASPYVARDFADALAKSGGDYREFLRQSGHPGNVASSPLFDRFGAIYQNIPQGMEDSYNWLTQRGYLTAQMNQTIEAAYTGGGEITPVMIPPGQTSPENPLNPANPANPGKAIEDALGKIGTNIRQGIEAAVATLFNRMGVSIADFWNEYYPALILFIIAVILILIAIAGLVLRYVFPAGRTINQLRTGLNIARQGQQK